VKKSLHRLLRKEELARYQLSRAAATKDFVKWKAAIWEKDSIEPAMLRYLSAQLN
jgi:hypothetical protein